MGPIKKGRWKNGGFVLLFVLMMSALLFSAIGIILFNLTVHSKNKVNTRERFKTDMAQDGGPQAGLVILNKRLSYLPQRIADGVTVDGTPHLIGDSDISRYALHSPASFWIDWMNDIRDNGSPVAEQPNFVLIDTNTASFTVETASRTITITLKSGFWLSDIQDSNSQGYNNVTLRYGYEITSRQKYVVVTTTVNNGVTVTSTGTVLGNPVTIESVMRAQCSDCIDKLIQVHLARELSRYNLFAISDKMPDGTILYDRTSYSGDVYLGDTFFMGGSPTFNGLVKISKLASPPFSHQTLGSNFVFKKPGGGLNPPSYVDPIAMPTSSTWDTMKILCNRMDVGQNPNAATVPGVYVGSSAVAGAATNSSIYVNATDAVDTVIKISQPSISVNRFRVTHGADDQTIDQDIALMPTFLIFVDGRLLIEGTLAEGTKATFNASGDVIITNDLKYASGGVSPNTVLGLVSWTGNILVTNGLPAPRNLVIHGVLMAVNGAFGAQGYEDFTVNYPQGYIGSILHTGALIRKWNLPTLSNDGTKGWGIQSTYDSALAQSKAPPYFPANGNYKLIDPCTVVEVYAIKS